MANDSVRLLSSYYKHLFPTHLLCEWLSHPRFPLNHREISFTLQNDVYLRFQSFDSPEDLHNFLLQKVPLKIDIGAVYATALHFIGAPKEPVEKELVIDIDLSDSDDVRTCCKGENVCKKCWKLMVVACKIVDAALREDFGFRGLLWVFSGRRGVHCWVSDKSVWRLRNELRSVVGDYLQVLKFGAKRGRVEVGENLHLSLRRALRIIEEKFEEILVEQEILGGREAVAKFLQIIDSEPLRIIFKKAMEATQDPLRQWKIFKDTFEQLKGENRISSQHAYLIEQLKLFYAYPRLDVNVTRTMNHLLKAPFCVHPVTGKIAVPFKIENIDDFDPDSVPTLSWVNYQLECYGPVEGKFCLAEYIKILEDFIKGLND